MQEEIFVTGAGVISAIGLGRQATLAALREGRDGIAPVRYLKTSRVEFPVGEVKFSNEEMCRLLGVPEAGVTTRTSLMGMIAAREALEQARLPGDGGERVALISGTTVGGMDKSEQYYLDFLENDSRNEYISAHDCGACTEMIADYFGLFSMVETISTACSSAANAIMTGALLLRAGRADVVVAGGSECITKFHLNGFNTLMILDREPCRPFDAGRAGLNLGEGAAYLVLESGASARRRGVVPLCRLSGYANASDAFHQTASSPGGDGAYLSMTGALATAGLAPGEIGYINAHGTGTVNNDLSEGLAIQRVFGERVPPVSSTKAFTGHATSAAGGVEAVISILALRHGFIPPNLRFSTPMPELSFAPAAGGSAAPRHVLSNSFGFGGNDTSLIFSKTD
ncbi:MAG: beta-ketoacyl-[acyl-carrier-protein] synthase family protein [Odoribacteraceae bacterium]|jgi:3-oxoacyl-[acyl-carrier-protein] synthase-1|nr:beta-ketoacyl-[acyl-carrier-protein] synthase family protein [Odoribacteraceae bacterium]